MGLGVRFDPGVIETPVGVLGDLLDELVGALTKSAKGGWSLRSYTQARQAVFHLVFSSGLHRKQT